MAAVSVKRQRGAFRSAMMHAGRDQIGGDATLSGYQAQIEDLRSSARAARSASEQASEVRIAAAFDGAGAAMSGSRSESLLVQAGNALGDDVAGWVTRADAYAADLAAAADRYSANEDAAAADFAAQAGG